MLYKQPDSDKHFALVTLILCTATLTWEGVNLFSWDGSFNGLDLLVVITMSIIGTKAYAYIFNSWE